MTVRLTEDVLQQVLQQNEGHQSTTHYKGKNIDVTHHYEITGGELHVREAGKTSWADSRFDNEVVADVDQTRRFVRRNITSLNTEGIDTTVAKRQTRRDEAIDSSRPQDDEGSESEVDTSEAEDAAETDNNIIGLAIVIVSVLGLAYLTRKATPHAMRLWADKAVPMLDKARSRFERGGNEPPALPDTNEGPPP